MLVCQRGTVDLFKLTTKGALQKSELASGTIAYAADETKLWLSPSVKQL